MTPTAKSLAARTVGLLMCTAAAVALSGCKPGAQQAAAADAPPPLAALPLSGADAPPARLAPVAVDLPYARPARLGPLLDAGDGYAYLDRAYVLNDAFADAPPDYGFDYADDEMPWAWRTDDGFIRVAEFLPYGVRYDYYEPGEDYPFLIRDPDYAYAYADGDLVAIYGPDDALLPPEDLALRAPIAGRELARAQAIFHSAGQGRQPVALDNWTTRRIQIATDLGRWRDQEGRQPAWRRYHQEHQSAEEAHWAPERFRRAVETARLDRQIKDPDGADHAMRIAAQAQDTARRAHVTVATLPHGRPAEVPNPAPTRMAANAPATRRGPEALAPLEARGPGIERSRPTRLADAEAARPRPLAMAQIGREPRAQFNVHDRADRAAPAALAEPHLHAAEQIRAPREARSEMASRPFQRPAQAPGARAPEALHPQLAQAAPRGGAHAAAGIHPPPHRDDDKHR